MDEGRKKIKKWVFLTLGILIIAGIGGFVYVKSQAAPTMAPISSTIQAKQGSIKITISGSGSIAASAKEDIKAGAGGEIENVLVKEGDLVKKGQPVITYTSGDFADKIYQEELSIQSKQLDLEASMLKLKKNEDETKVDELKNNIKKLQLDIELSNSKINTYKKDQEAPAPVLATIDGEVITLNNAIGDKLGNNASVGQIVNYAELKLDIQVDELDVLKVKVGQAAEITLDALTGKKFKGEVTSIAREGVSTNGVSVFTVTIKLIEQDSIKAGMSSRAEIVVEDKSNILVVPIEAIQQRQGKSFVLVQGEGESTAKDTGKATGKATDRATAGATGTEVTRNTNTNQPNINANLGTMREVQVGIKNESYAEIISGLKEGENVVIPTASTTTQTANPRQMQIQGGSGGFSNGGFGGGGGSFPAGGMQGGNTGTRR